MIVLWTIGILAAVVALGWLLLNRRNPFERRVDAALGSGLGCWTEAGVDVSREKGTQMLRDGHVAAIDEGLSIVFERAKARGWRRYLSHSEYIVVVLKSEMYKGIPVIRMPDGTYASGAGNDMRDRVFAVAECTDEQTADLRQSVINEAEHVILYHNDRALFDRTKVHSDGEGHPLF